MHACMDQSFRVIVTGAADGVVQDIQSGVHRLKSDEPAAAGGTDQGPDPYALLLAALGSCTSITIGMYARRKNIPLQRVTVRLRQSKIHAEDCTDCERKLGRIDLIERQIELTGELTTEQRASLLDIANRCPVHRTLTSEIKIDTTLAASS
jgi:putative redox protein